MKLTLHTDAGHGWVEVPMTLVRDLGIAHKITPYSYQSTDRTVAYLEEDCDAATLVKALAARGDTIEWNDDIDVAGDSFIRRLPRFRMYAMLDDATKGPL